MTRSFFPALNSSLLPGGEIVPADHGQAVREQAVGQMGTDETGGAGHEDFLHETMNNGDAKTANDSADVKASLHARVNVE